MDGTPIYDIKPYVTYADAVPDAASGFVDVNPWQPLTVVIPDELRQQLLDGLPGAKEGLLHLEALEEILAQDPRPQYSHGSKIYGLAYGPWNIRFTVAGTTLTVISIEK